MRRYIFIAAVLLTALSVTTAPVAGFTQPAEVIGSEHNTSTDFNNADTLDNLAVNNGQVYDSGESVFEQGFEGMSNGLDGWTLYNDGGVIDLEENNLQAAHTGDNSLRYYPGDTDQDGIALNENYQYTGSTGTMRMHTWMFTADNDDIAAYMGAGPALVDSSTGDYYFVRGVTDNDDRFRLGKVENGQITWLTPSGQGYYDGVYHKLEIAYSHDGNNVAAFAYDNNGNQIWSDFYSSANSITPDRFGVRAAANSDYTQNIYFDDMEFTIPNPPNTEYVSQSHNVEDVTQASATIDTLSGGEATIEVVDGDGDTLNSKTVTSSGQYFVDVNPSGQSASTVNVRVTSTDTGEKGDLAFAMSRERVYFIDDPPSATIDSVTDGTTVYTNTPSLTTTVDDPEFDLTQGDTVTAEWYVDGQKVHEETGITSQSQLSYEPAAFSEGSHSWYVRVVDEYGGEYSTNTQTFTVDHKDPIIDNSTADPDGITTPYSSNTLSIDIADGDFGVDGDSLTVGWYVDGTLVHEDSGISSNQTVSYDTAALGEGTHNWYVKVGDSWGGKTTSQTFSYEISHVPPEVTNPSIDGLTHYETNTLAVDIDDGDFTADGDTLTVGFYVDGAKVNEQTISSAQRVSFDAGPYADGNYTWHVEVADNYGYKTVSDTWDLDIDHDDPNIANPSIDGTTYYENNTLSVDVSDNDFTRDGDSVTVGIYVDGAKIKETTISGDQTVSADVGPYADGTYTWRVEAADEYGYLTVSPDYELTIDHDDPAVSNPSLDGVTHYENNTLAVDVADRDFRYDGDTVDVGFYVDGGLVNTQTITSNQTVTYDAGPYADGNYTWHVEAVDDYGYKTVSNNWTLEIDHDPPTPIMDTASPQDETIRYENATLSFTVEDGDFLRDGDTVDIVWYVDDTPVHTDTVIQNGTYEYTTPALADGDHSWRVGLYDDYGYVRNSTTLNFTVDHSAPTYDPDSSSPTGTIRQQQPTFTLDVEDADFPVDGDSVDVGLYINETNEQEPWLAGVDTLYQNRTAEVTPSQPISGDANYKWRLIDDYGYDVNTTDYFIDAPNSLYLHDATPPHDLLNTTAAATVITGSNQTADLDSDTDGSIEFGDLPQNETYVFVVGANGYYQRSVYIEDLYSRSVIFLINTSDRVVNNRIQLDDQTGNFQENPVIQIETVINTTEVENMPDNGPEWVTVGGDRLGLSESMDVTLRYGGRYRFTIISQSGITRTVGYYSARETGTLNLDIGQLAYPAPEEQGYAANAITNASDNTVSFIYNDVSEKTDGLDVTLETRDGDEIDTKQLRAGTWGKAVVTFTVDNETYANNDFIVRWQGDRDGESIGGSMIISGEDMSLGFPLGDMWLQIVYGGLVIILAFMTGIFLGPAKAFITLGLASGAAALMGIAPVALGLGTGILVTALGATMIRWQNQNVQPQ